MISAIIISDHDDQAPIQNLDVVPDFSILKILASVELEWNNSLHVVLLQI